ncbi:uncharacterized protein LOC116891311 [Rattus rattus]|uniref:uncharacterized protein LOC116891311 n=1 Tax=Rattus rattus TaxID=10117 RepID=UPI0013F303E4|nr:uncharacterized protein LOC116891311 [Rattus rattus]
MAEEGKGAGGEVDVNTALQEVLKTALIHDGLARGIREAAKALDKRHALLCVLASDSDELMYVKRVEALCAEHQINLIKVDGNKKPGVGLCKIHREGKPPKVVGCCCMVVKDCDKESQDVIEEYFKYKKWINKILKSHCPLDCLDFVEHEAGNQPPPWTLPTLAFSLLLLPSLKTFQEGSFIASALKYCPDHQQPENLTARPPSKPGYSCAHTTLPHTQSSVPQRLLIAQYPPGGVIKLLASCFPKQAEPSGEADSGCH